MRAIANAFRPQSFNAAINELQSLDESFQQGQNTGQLGEKPLVVLTGTREPNVDELPPGVLPSQLPLAPVINVELGEHEDIEWTWTTLPSGQQYVSGYTIIKKTD